MATATWIIGSKFPVVLAANIPEYWRLIVPILSDINSGSVGHYN